MKQKNDRSFIPVLTSPAGSCLTLANWQEAGINTVACYLDTLLIKPGLSFLKSLKNLRAYCGWQGELVLNASTITATRRGTYTIRSPYDGSMVSIDNKALVSLMISLQPDVVILPDDFIEHGFVLPETIKWFAAPKEVSQVAGCGRYLFYDEKRLFCEFIELIRQTNPELVYVSGNFTLSQIRELSMLGVLFVESDKPATNALSGQVYTEQGLLDLCDVKMAHQQERIEPNCSCPTCTQGFSRAYLHHLLIQTPLLCQRFLIHHNSHYYQNQYEIHKTSFT
ncbi:hypothetical protein [Legionella fairfieldensis]|uniref:hypothetical protein n=1 Tax=Legionella fairfieldensis TaxID=45064 RepID=UPI000684536C|nr:hypothetical protein [Legionella fairfieldensis]